MKILQGILISLLFIFSSSYSEGKKLLSRADNSIDTAGMSNYREGLYIGTDRKLYITGEQVWFKVYKLNSASYVPSDLSRIVYIELLNNSNNPVVQLKIDAQGTSGSGYFRIPEDLESGNYLIRAYTSWMLNFPVDKFFFRTISIINPFRDIGNLIPPVTYADRNSKMISEDSGPALTKKTGKADIGDLNIRMDNKDYATRSKVRLILSAYDASGNPVRANLSVSVIKSCLADTLENIVTAGGSAEGNSNYSITTISHLPDIEGELISGIIKGKNSDEPLKNTDISLSIVGKVPESQFAKTNEKGEFSFILKGVHGMNEIVIQPMSRNIGGCFVELNPQFSNVFTDNKLPAFYLDSNKVRVVNQAIISKQVNALYEEEIGQKQDLDENRAAYGLYYKPTRKINMSDYIELTDVKEILKELLSEVLIEKENGQMILKVVSNNPYEQFENQALVLVDGVPDYDIENLLRAKASGIESVEIITSRYFYHNYIFEGIINITTKTGNLSIFSFNGSVYRRVYEASQKKSHFYSPDYSDKLVRDNHIPDFRNLLFWDPDLETSYNGEAVCEFFSSDEPGDYTIVAEGITPEGIKVFGTSNFVVQ